MVSELDLLQLVRYLEKKENEGLTEKIQKFLSIFEKICKSNPQSPQIPTSRKPVMEKKKDKKKQGFDLKIRKLYIKMKKR